MIKVRVRYSGLLADILGKGSEEICVHPGTTLGRLLDVILASNAALREWRAKIPIIQVFLNGVEVSNREVGRPLRDGDEITLAPPLYEGG